MSRPNKHKIPTDSAVSSSGGLVNAFANLDISGLPPGAPEPEVPEPSRVQVGRPAKPGRVVLRRETAHRGGKCVIVIDDFDPAFDAAALQTLSKRLRAACGCGGAVKERTIELQGDQVTRIREFLGAEGFRVAGEVSGGSPPPAIH